MSPELQALIDKANSDISNLLNTYGNSTDPSYVKTSKILAYWLSDYVRFIKKEQSFDPSKLKKYKRGDILQAHLGFNIGSEEGGLHYVVVISNNTPSSSDVLTVIPLSSKKETYKPSQYTLDLGDTIYTQLTTKYSTLQKNVYESIQSITKEFKSLNETRNQLIHQISDATSKEDAFNDKMNEVTQLIIQMNDKATELTSLQNEYDTIQKVQSEISHMKAGSIALVGQITTISKIRIYNPINKKGSLHGIRLCDEYMDKIDESVRNLFTHQK